MPLSGLLSYKIFSPLASFICVLVHRQGSCELCVFLFYLNECKHPDIKLKDRMELNKLIMSGKEYLFVVKWFEVQSLWGNGFLHCVCKEDEKSSVVGTKYMQHNTNAFPFFDVEIIC